MSILQPGDIAIVTIFNSPWEGKRVEITEMCQGEPCVAYDAKLPNGQEGMFFANELFKV